MLTATAARPSRIALAVVVALLTVACYQVQAPPVPTSERIPTVVGQIVGGTPRVVYELSNGEIVEIRDSTGAHLRQQLGDDVGDPPGLNGPEGGLILAGEDAVGKFYAATRSPESDGCFRIFSPGYLQQERVVLSTGLVLRLTPDVRIQNERPDIDPSWLLSTDRICLDGSGEVWFIHQRALGA